MRAKQAGEYLGVTAQTVRNWCNRGEIPSVRSAANQRLFSLKDLEEFKNRRLGITAPKQERTVIFYTRTSSKNDVSIENQKAKLVKAYGECDYEFSDTASGMRENRKGIQSLISKLQKLDRPAVVYVTNKDRLAKFGFLYLQQLFAEYNCVIEVLDDDESKEPLEVLMQDFMSLLASFSGKFYRMRGWEQQAKFLDDAKKELETRVQNG